MAQYQNAPMEGLEGQYNAPKKQLNESQLGRVAEAIGKNYELLGTELGITEVELDRIKLECTTFVQQVKGMLLLWQRKFEENATMDILCNAMSRKRTVVTINKSIVKEVISDMSLVE